MNSDVPNATRAERLGRHWWYP